MTPTTIIRLSIAAAALSVLGVGCGELAQPQPFELDTDDTPDQFIQTPAAGTPPTTLAPVGGHDLSQCNELDAAGNITVIDCPEWLVDGMARVHGEPSGGVE